jgi:transcriptional regulator with XRE-family HTH domain
LDTELEDAVDALQAYMRAKHIPQRDMAKRINKDQATLSRYLSRKSTPNVTTANKIAVATGGAVKPSMWDQQDG